MKSIGKYRVLLVEHILRAGSTDGLSSPPPHPFFGGGMCHCSNAYLASFVLPTGLLFLVLFFVF